MKTEHPMSNTFVPMGPPALFAAGNDFIPLSSRLAPAANGKTVPGANGHATPSPAAAAAPAQHCAPPKVTLQRQGDVVSSIRIQCGCGQVIELSCVY
jgi:hypothetical protein